ncbi:MAG TPA: hypothetical protein VFR97_14580 [Capillimicrobium sp.]|nr:hypothetical protein [Capillimicrobium sp.]
MSTDQTTQQRPQAETETTRLDERERPDLSGPRGNQEVEDIDVERGREKIDRVLGW